MNNLQKFREFEINDQQLAQIKGGWIKWVRDFIKSGMHTELWRHTKEFFSDEEMEKYGRRIYETGSPGGHK